MSSNPSSLLLVASSYSRRASRLLCALLLLRTLLLLRACSEETQLTANLTLEGIDAAEELDDLDRCFLTAFFEGTHLAAALSCCM
jgi:hypothetical protein